MLSAMARELVERNGIGETADAVWRALNTEHQKLFPGLLGATMVPASIEMPGILLEISPSPPVLLKRYGCRVYRCLRTATASLVERGGVDGQWSRNKPHSSASVELK